MVAVLFFIFVTLNVALLHISYASNDVSTSSISVDGGIVPPTIDIAPLIHPERYSQEEIANVQNLIRSASETWGFYNIINHSISTETIERLQSQMKSFFDLPKEIKNTIRRNRYNSRGYADNEYTKQIIDLKEVFDLGQLQPYNASTPGLSAVGLSNQELDGVNQWPDEDTLPNFRAVIEDYYEQSLQLSNILVNAIIDSLDFCFLQKNEALTSSSSSETSHSDSSPHTDSILKKYSSSQEFYNANFHLHSSLMRLNYYPISSNLTASVIANADGTTLSERLGISRHTDAGAITILLQDLHVSSLEVYSGTKQDEGNGRWVPVTPVPNALTINSADMLQVWTNNRLKAPEHRVRATRPDSAHPRYSVAFFLNPNYDSMVTAHPCKVNEDGSALPPFYRPIRWGDFRSLRYLGDYEDVGEEIQIEKYRIK
eukprot:gene1917-2051_t